MAVIRKLGTGIIKIRDTRTTNDGTQTKVETWKGPYKLLEAKQNAIGFTAKSTNLAPDGPNGILTITYEIPAPEDYQFTGSQTSIEVVWQELRKPIEQHPMFKNVPATEKKKAKDAAELEGEASEAAAQQLDTIAKKLYDFLINGTTDYNTGVPLVRRTKTRMAGSEGGGGAWFRDKPPVSVPGSWEWLKTADERRKDGRAFTLTEEWTGATEWDKELYP